MENSENTPRSAPKRQKRLNKFSDVEKHELAKLVKERPRIWDLTDPNSNKNAMDQAWEAISAVLGKSGNLKMADLVRGEASESDEEAKALDALQRKLIFASEVSGEDSESDEDVYEQRTTEEIKNKCTEILKNNLLQRKLIESNIAIWKNLNAYVKNFVLSASKQLLSTDNMLIKSQVSMQVILSSLKTAQINILHLHETTNDTFTTNFIPNINK